MLRRYEVRIDKALGLNLGEAARRTVEEYYSIDTIAKKYK